jgi:hypothetical protein
MPAAQIEEDAIRCQAAKILKRQFEAFAEHSRRFGMLKSASCFDALAASVLMVPPELLDAYMENFQTVEQGKIDFALRRSIQQGLWSPATAAEFIQRFVAFSTNGPATPM